MGICLGLGGCNDLFFCLSGLCVAQGRFQVYRDDCFPGTVDSECLLESCFLQVSHVDFCIDYYKPFDNHRIDFSIRVYQEGRDQGLVGHTVFDLDSTGHFTQCVYCNI